MHGSVALFVFVTFGAAYVVFLLWYGGRGRPMTEDEAGSRVKMIERTARAAGAGDADQGLLEALREVGRNDDGREFVMVNLIKYRANAAYPPGYSYDHDARAADLRLARFEFDDIVSASREGPGAILQWPHTSGRSQRRAVVPVGPVSHVV
jgi:hypothetical protein